MSYADKIRVTCESKPKQWRNMSGSIINSVELRLQFVGKLINDARYLEKYGILVMSCIVRHIISENIDKI